MLLKFNFQNSPQSANKPSYLSKLVLRTRLKTDWTRFMLLATLISNDYYLSFDYKLFFMYYLEPLEESSHSLASLICELNTNEEKKIYLKCTNSHIFSAHIR